MTIPPCSSRSRRNQQSNRGLVALRVPLGAQLDRLIQNLRGDGKISLVSGRAIVAGRFDRSPRLKHSSLSLTVPDVSAGQTGVT